MKSVYINDELHRQAKIRAAEEGRTLREFVEEQVKRGLQRKPPKAAPRVLKEQAVTYRVEMLAFVETLAFEEDPCPPSTYTPGFIRDHLGPCCRPRLPQCR